MLCIAFIVCLVIVWRRRATGTTIVAPVAVMILSLARLTLLAMTIAGLIGAFRSVKTVAPAEKATVLAASIGESMNYARIGIAWDLPLIVLAWVADLFLRRRKEAAPPVAPAGAKCALHASESATRTCLRCGSLMCANCASLDERRCPPCRERLD